MSEQGRTRTKISHHAGTLRAVFVAVMAAALAFNAVDDEPAAQLSLSWAAPPQCPSRDEVLGAVESFAAPEDWASLPDDVKVDAQVDDDGDGYTLAMTLSAGDLTLRREVRATDCANLRDAAALVIGVSLDMLATASPEPVLEVSEPAPATVEPEALPPEPAPRWHPDVRVGGGVFMGPVPWSGGFVAGVGLTRSAVRLEFLGHAWLPTRVEPFDTDGGARIGGGGLDARACLVPRWSSVELPLCGGIGAGVVTARGVDLEAVTNVRRPYVIATLGQQLQWWSPSGVGLSLAVDGIVGVLRPHFIADDLGTVRAAPVLGARGLGMVGYRFGQKNSPKRRGRGHGPGKR